MFNVAIAPSNADLIAFCNTIVSLDKAGILSKDAFKAVEPVQVTPTIEHTPVIRQTRKAAEVKPTRKPVTVKSSAKHLVATKNGGMMDSRPGSSTPNQIRKLVALFADNNLEALTAIEKRDLGKMSMAAVSDYRFDIISDLNADA